MSVGFVEFSVCLQVDMCYTSPFCVEMYPMEHLQALEQEAERMDTHKTPTRSLSLTETWYRVIWEGTG